MSLFEILGAIAIAGGVGVASAIGDQSSAIVQWPGILVGAMAGVVCFLAFRRFFRSLWPQKNDDGELGSGTSHVLYVAMPIITCIFTITGALIVQGLLKHAGA